MPNKNQDNVRIFCTKLFEKTQKHRSIGTVVLVVSLLSTYVWAESALEFPGPAPGDGQGRISSGQLFLQNKVLECSWDIREAQLKPRYVTDKLSATTLRLRNAECFQLILKSGRTVKASELKIVGKPTLKNLEPNRKSSRLAESGFRRSGKLITAKLTSSDDNLNVEWRAILRDGSNYVRRQVVLTTKNKPINIKEIVLLDLDVSQAKVMGTVDGSPVVAGNIFFAYEHPLSKSRVLQGSPSRLRCSLPCSTELKPGKPLMQSCVIGVVPQGQLRRGFLYYVERERAHPYRPFLHYNSWYDIGYGAEKIQQRQCMDVIDLFGKELVRGRNVVMDSFALDDGWDDTASLWRFHKGFPNGFAPLRKVVEKYDSALGAWLSPFGGYGKAKQDRLKYGRQQGFETNKSGFSLAGPTYHARFRNVCVNMIREYGLNYFKFDGIGTGDRPTGAGAEFVYDMSALLKLVSELREVKPDIFVNITTGTWSSPYWLWYGDSTWRSGADWSTHGWGSKRQQQITYRDKETYHNVVVRAPLYPLNSLMTQGVMFANHGLPDEVNDLTDDIKAFFAGGTNCQELYITPSLMRPQDWDALAEAAKWSRNNADVLVDTHWVGGDPARGQIYGWAAWSKRKGILSLRNPHDKPAKLTLDIGKTFELPAPVLPAQETQVQVPTGAPQKYSLKSPWKQDANKAAIVLSAVKEHTFELKPFEVLVFDATPQ
ncbi:MAG TPA: enterotoxin [Planctomycetes bacterium]|nr:enterotoxin [Planctomycetota bacterium]